MDRERSRRTHLKRQVEKILDESSEEEHSVIVQMLEPIGELQRVYQASAEALSRRQLTLSPRELVPAHAEVIREKDALSRSHRRKLHATANFHVVAGDACPC